MANSVFRSTAFQLGLLVDNIDRGDIALPDIQRPFVWATAKVRDLFDSMYNGFPVGYLLFWETGAEVGARQIGVADKDARVPRWLIVDGQQRLTSLYSVLKGHEIVREDYSQGRIRLAFRPNDATFAVTDAAIERDPQFLPDITDLWTDFRACTRGYFARLEAAHDLLDHDERSRLEDAFDRLRDLQSYQFAVMELDSAVDEERVAEIFVRINSEGVTLSQADFILTLMSVFWEKGRLELEDFSRSAKVPTTSGPSAFNWFIQPQPPQMLRVSVALGFRRAVLRHVYSLLRGKDLDTGEVDSARREAQFAKVQQAQEKVLDLTNWHEFLQCLERAGFRGSKMISSENAVIYTYALWLAGRVDYGVPLDRLRELIARWFFMAHTTGRYSGSFESQVERDLAALREVPEGHADGFCMALSKIIDDTLTADFWTITLPNQLGSSAAKSPALLAYIAALNILDADALLSTTKIRSRLDPALTLKKGIERHHLFPREYLRKRLGIKELQRINQIANMALVEWSDNIAISDDPPDVYWPSQVAAKTSEIGLSATRLASQMHWHALPRDWENMDYDTFLAERRRLMAGVAREAFEHLADLGYQPEYPPPSTVPEDPPALTSYGVSMGDLVRAGLLQSGADLLPTKGGFDAVATVLPDGRLDVNGQVFDTPSGAGHSIRNRATNGWHFWAADLPEGSVPLFRLRERFLAEVEGELEGE